MPKFILSTHQKGGVGKSTITYNLACALNRNAKVAICDLDAQGTLAEIRGISEVPIYSGISELEKLKSSDYDFVFVDSPPYLTSSLPDLLKFMDAILVPTKVGLADFMAISKTLEMVGESGKTDKTLIVLNMVKPNTTLTTEMQSSLAKVNVPLAETKLSDLVAYTRSFATGGLDEDKAKNQINSLLVEVLTLLSK